MEEAPPLLRHVLELVPDPAFLRRRRDGVILEANPGFAELVGRSPEALVGERLEALGLSFAREATDSPLPGAEAGGRVRGLPVRVTIDGDEDREEVHLITSRVVELGGEPCILSVARDVTERRKAEEQRARLSQILRTTAEGILMTDAEGDFRYANPAAEEMLGLRASDIRGRAYDDPRWEICGPDGGDLAEEELPVARALRDETAVRGFEHGVVRPDGSRIVLSVNAAPLTDGEGRVTGVVASIRDVTEKKRREERIRQSEKRYRDLFEHNVAGAFRSIPDGEILDCNEAFAEIFGYESPDALEGRDATVLYPSAEDRRRYLEQLREKGRLVNEELRLERRDGSPVWVLENSVATEDPETGERVNQGTLVDITERKRAESRLEEMVYRDPLTGLGNRRLLEDRAESLLSLADRRDQRAGLAYLDIDRFQEVNDRWGHGTGDRVLCEVAARLENESRESDLLARVGGDEFVLLLADLDEPDQALTTTRRITTAFDVPFSVENQEIELGASAGVAVYPDDGEDLDALLRRADRALYRADQRSGGLARYRSEIDVRLSDEAGFDRRIREALEAGETTLHFQPIFRLLDGAPVGAEALVRWEHPERGLIAAGDFVPRAERTGVIRAVDAWVIRRAVRRLTEWQERGSGPTEVAVNLSAASFRDPGVLRRIASVLDDADPPDRAGLVIEITEAEAMEDPAVAGELLRAFGDTGVRVALDDFGTGHSSLSYLDQFPVDRIKLDRSFISKLEPESGDTRLVEAMLQLARTLELETVAEGVEEACQRDWLRRAGADLAQGFLLAKPLPASRVETLWGEPSGGRPPAP